MIRTAPNRFHRTPCPARSVSRPNLKRSTAPEGERSALAPTATETYQPLSLLALAGFGLAVVYALVVVIGAAVALFGRIPWLMPSWTYLLPIAALILCGAARMRIRDSEGTMSGMAFTTWGLRLAVIVGLTYAAYNGATFFAVRGQAVDCADTFFEYLKRGELEQAYLFSMGIPAKDVDKAELRNMLESRFNTPKGPSGSVGDFSRFQPISVSPIYRNGRPRDEHRSQGSECVGIQ